MLLINLIIVLVVIGLILWLINTYVPLDPTIKRILNIAVIIFVLIWLLSAIGVLGTLSDIRIGE